MKVFTNLKHKSIYIFILSIVILFSLPCVAYAEIDFADNVLTSGIEIQVKANVDPEIQGDILVWVSNLDEHFDTYTTLYAHNNYTQTIYVKNPGKYQITSVSYNGMLTSDHQVEYKEIEVVSGITNHLIFSIGNPVISGESTLESDVTVESEPNTDTTEEKAVVYSESVFREYSDKKYREIYGKTTCYEDNILIVVLTDENSDEKYSIACVGENFDSLVRDNWFGNYEESSFYNVMNAILDVNYEGTLSDGLVFVVDYYAEAFKPLVERDIIFVEESDKTKVAESCFYNYTDSKFSESSINTALEKFTNNTGITLCIVVEDAKEVFNGEKITENESFNDNDNSQQVDEENLYEDVVVEEDSTSLKKVSISTDVIISIIGIVVVVGGASAFTVFWLKRSKK